MANSGLVQSGVTAGVCSVVHITSAENSHSTTGHQPGTPTQENAVSGFHFIREQLKSKGLPENTIEIIMLSWKKSTAQQYGTYFRKWLLFSNKAKIDLLKPSVGNVLAFLTELFTQGLGYSAVNTAKSVLSSFYQLIDNRDIGNETIVKRFMKGVFTKRPSLPKYNRIWDVQLVLNYLSSLPDTSQLSLLQLSEKLVVLFMLLTGQRCQTIHSLKLSDIHIDAEQVVCYITVLIKQSKPGCHVQPLKIKRYSVNNKLCLVSTLEAYIEHTKTLRNSETNLFIGTVKPFTPVTKSTLSRWIKSCMGKAGIDIEVFGVHSCRAASTSAAAAKGLQIDSIMKAAGWSTARTFAIYYNKTVEKSFSESILPEVVGQ